jgi:hypothetical protein
MTTAAFPTADCRRSHWRPFILAAMTRLSDVGDGNVKFNEILTHIESLPGFPGWATWGDYNGKANQMGRRFVSLEATAMKKEGLLTSPRRGTYRLASEAPVVDAPVVEPSVAHKAVLTVVPDPDPEIKAPEPVEAPVEPTVAEGPTTHPLYVANERARMIAIEQTRCFGFYSERAKTCGDCPLAGLCFAARGGKVAEANARAEEKAREASLAATVVNALGDTTEAADEAAADASGAVLNEADSTPKIPVFDIQSQTTHFVPETETPEETPEAAAEETSEVVIPAGGNVINLPFGVVCSHCGWQAEKWSDVISVAGKGTYHMGCASHAV